MAPRRRARGLRPRSDQDVEPLPFASAEPYIDRPKDSWCSELYPQSSKDCHDLCSLAKGPPQHIEHRRQFPTAAYSPRKPDVRPMSPFECTWVDHQSHRPLPSDQESAPLLEDFDSVSTLRSQPQSEFVHPATRDLPPDQQTRCSKPDGCDELMMAQLVDSNMLKAKHQLFRFKQLSKFLDRMRRDNRSFDRGLQVFAQELSESEQTVYLSCSSGSPEPVTVGATAAADDPAATTEDATPPLAADSQSIHTETTSRSRGNGSDRGSGRRRSMSPHQQRARDLVIGVAVFVLSILFIVHVALMSSIIDNDRLLWARILFPTALFVVFMIVLIILRNYSPQ